MKVAFLSSALCLDTGLSVTSVSVLICLGSSIIGSTLTESLMATYGLDRDSQLMALVTMIMTENLTMGT